MSASVVRVERMSLKLKLSQQVPVVLLSVFAMFMPHSASAQTSSAPAPSLEPLETELLNPDAPLARRDVITANTISPTGITNPSFWWAKQQFDEFEGKLINNWIAYRDEKRVDLVVNSQLWTLLDYLGRYRFVHKFGNAASDYQYDVRVFNQQAALLATYTCDRAKTSVDCQIRVFNSIGPESLPVPRQPLVGN